MSYRPIIPKYDAHTSNSLQDIRQIQLTMKYRSQWPTNILRSDVRSYWLIIPKYDDQPLNSFQDIRQNQWNLGYSVLQIFWGQTLVILTHNPKYGVHIPNSLQDIRQNYWNMKYKSQWPTFILRSNVVSYWLIIPKYDVHTSNSLQDIRQNHWTMKYRSWWPHLFWGQTSGHTDS